MYVQQLLIKWQKIWHLHRLMQKKKGKNERKQSGRFVGSKLQQHFPLFLHNDAQLLQLGQHHWAMTRILGSQKLWRLATNSIKWRWLTDLQSRITTYSHSFWKYFNLILQNHQWFPIFARSETAFTVTFNLKLDFRSFLFLFCSFYAWILSISALKNWWLLFWWMK